MEKFTEILERTASVQVQALLKKWNEARREIDRQREVMKQAERELIECAARFKVGDVVRDTRDGKRYVIAKVETSAYALKGGWTEDKPYAEFNYTYRAICKDGHVSQNNSLAPSEGALEPTGKHIDIKQDGPLYAGRE